MTIVRTDLDSLRDLMIPSLRKAVDRLPPSVRDVAGYHFGWCDELGRPTTCAPGKLVRPMLTLLSAEAVGAPAESAMDGAVAIELVHNFSLIHDDVMDGDTVRRHRRTVWSVFDMPTAILTGDALLVLAMEVLADTPAAVAVLGRALQSLVEGQCRDLAFERRDDVSVTEALAMAGGKTADLLGCACELGAIRGGGTQAQAVALRRFGWHVGIAFQLVDDILGIWGDPAVTGKPVLSDLRARKKSLPVVAALADCDELASLYLGLGPLDEHELAEVAALVERAGGRAWAQSEAEHHVAQALHHLDLAEATPSAADALAGVAARLTRRHR